MLYNIDNIDLHRNKRKKGIILMIILFSAVAVILTGLSFLIRYQFLALKNVKAYKFIGIFLFIILGWVEIYILFETVFVNNNKIKVLESVNRAKRVDYEGEIIETGKTLTISKYEIATLVQFKSEKNTLSCYYSNYLGECPLKENTKYNITIANNRIVDYKEID